MSLWLTTKRVARYGLIGFIRNGFVSLSAILIMTITLFVIAFLFIAGAALDSALTGIKNKVDVNVYFTTNATEDQVMQLRGVLEKNPEVASVAYTSREAALAEFRERHKNEASTIQALDQLSENPLGASLAIRAKQTSQYESIAQFLEATQGSSEGAIISKVNFNQNKAAIDRLTAIIAALRAIGIGAAIFFGSASILIAFNTIRLTIYTARDEIGVMNLVGAAHWYVRGPFMIAGVLYGAISGIVVLLILYPMAAWLGPPSLRFFGTFNVLDYYISSFGLLFVSIMGMGVLLGAISSYLAVRRYLRN
ncbi:MAG: permease-like cell division protein FtsX [Patescibacteria group bacterium]